MKFFLALEHLWDPFVWQEVGGVASLQMMCSTEVKKLLVFFPTRFISDCKCFYISFYAAPASGKSRVLGDFLLLEVCDTVKLQCCLNDISSGEHLRLFLT